MTVVDYRSGDGVAVITLNRPEKRNAVDAAVTTALEAALDRVESDPDVRVAVLRAEIAPGVRPVFCAGHDLTAGASADDGVMTERGGFAGITTRIREKPLIAAVDGLATGGGCEIVLACDLVIASDRAAFALPEVKWNLLAGGGGLFRLARVIGRPAAMDMALSASELSAQRAYDLGLVSRLVPAAELDAAALAFAREIASYGTRAVRLSRKVVTAAEYADDDAAWRLSVEVSAEVLAATADLADGLGAFARRKG